MNLIWKLLHLTTVIALVAGLIGRNLTFRLARNARDLAALAAYLNASSAFERLLVIPGSMLVLVTGALAIWLNHWTFRSGEGQPGWLLAGLVIYLTLIPVIAAVLAPRRAHRERALAGSLAAGQITPELTAALDDPVLRRARGYEALVVILVFLLMVLKPF